MERFVSLVKIAVLKSSDKSLYLLDNSIFINDLKDINLESIKYKTFNSKRKKSKFLQKKMYYVMQIVGSYVAVLTVLIGINIYYVSKNDSLDAQYNEIQTELVQSKRNTIKDIGRYNKLGGNINSLKLAKSYDDIIELTGDVE